MTERQLPWSRTCFVCGDDNPSGLGVRFVADNGRVRVRTRIDHGFEGYPGRVHGGIITALLDETAGWAATVAVDRLCFTARLTVRFIHPVPGGELIEVVGEHLGSRGGFEQARSRILGGDGRVLASADGLFSAVPEDTHREVVPQLRMPGRAAETSDIGGR